MIKSEDRDINMWEKYRHESQQTICIIGVLTLSVKLCKADGHFSSQEETDNYDESCYIKKNNITIEYQYDLDTQIENMSLMGLDKNYATDLEKYCKYTK